MAVRVFAGNTSDPSTVAVRIEILTKQFSIEGVIFMGDRGKQAADPVIIASIAHQLAAAGKEDNCSRKVSTTQTNDGMFKLDGSGPEHAAAMTFPC